MRASTPAARFGLELCALAGLAYGVLAVLDAANRLALHLLRTSMASTPTG